ncbi:hypothetical protein D3C84_579660 [compost metagenome]
MDLADVPVDVFGHLMLLFRRRGDLGVHVTDHIHRLANLPEAVARLTDARHRLLGHFQACMHLLGHLTGAFGQVAQQRVDFRRRVGRALGLGRLVPGALARIVIVQLRIIRPRHITASGGAEDGIGVGRVTVAEVLVGFALRNAFGIGRCLMFIRAPDFLVGPRSADDSRFIGSRKRSWSTRVLECGIAIIGGAIVGQITLSLRTSAVVGGN